MCNKKAQWVNDMVMAGAGVKKVTPLESRNMDKDIKGNPLWGKLRIET